MAEKKSGAKKASAGLKSNLDSIKGKVTSAKGKGNGRFSKFTGNKLLMIIATIILFVLLVLGVFTVGIYKYGWNDNATVELSRIIPYPAFFVNGSPVKYSKYQDYNKAYSTYITEFYIKGEKNIDPNSEEAKNILKDAKDRVKELLVKNSIVRSEVKKRNIKYTQKEIDESFAEFVKRTGGDEEVKNNLKKYYGLTVERFKADFFIDTFLAGKLQNAIQEDKTLNADAEKKAQEVLAKVKAGEDFAELAKKYSEDTTAAKGGDLDFLKKGQLVPEFEDALWKLGAPGQVSELVKTVYGYHIIKLVEIKGEERKASHILIKTRDFDTWMAEAVKNAKVKYWIK